MENVVAKHRNLIVLVAVLFLQVIGLAVQVKRTADSGSVRLIRLWTVSIITPVERGLVHGTGWMENVWRNYFYLRGVRQENRQLRDEIAQLRLEQVRMAQDAGQGQRLQALLKFKEQFISETIAAQVIGSSGSEQSRVLYIDKGARDGLRSDMAVITPTGIVGKIMRVFPTTAQVLEINDPSSGVGVILEKSRLQGILKGVPAGDALPMLHFIMADEKVEPGEIALTSGGDRIFPKGLPVGAVAEVNPGPEMFLNIRVKPAARLDRLEEVLIITKVVEKEATMVAEGPMRASEILAQRLPTVQPRPPEASGQSVSGTGVAPSTNVPAASVTAKPTAANVAPSAAASTLKEVPKVPTPKPAAANSAPTPAKVVPNVTGSAAQPAGVNLQSSNGLAKSGGASAQSKPSAGAKAPQEANTRQVGNTSGAATEGSNAGVKVINDSPAVEPKRKPAPPKPANSKPVAQNEATPANPN